MHNDDRELLLRTTHGARPADDKPAEQLASDDDDSASQGSDDRNQRNAEPAAEPAGGDSCQPGANEPEVDSDEVDRAFNVIAGALHAAGLSDSVAGSCALMVSATVAHVQGMSRDGFIALAGGAWDSTRQAIADGAIEIERRPEEK